MLIHLIFRLRVPTALQLGLNGEAAMSGQGSNADQVDKQLNAGSKPSKGNAIYANNRKSTIKSSKATSTSISSQTLDQHQHHHEARGLNHHPLSLTLMKKTIASQVLTASGKRVEGIKYYILLYTAI